MQKNKTENQIKGFKLVKSKGGIEEYKLEKNDLRVLLIKDRSFPVIGFMVSYLFGSKHEGLGETGLAHLLEHMAFKETKNSSGGSFFEEFEKIGAELNGTTWKDRTNYFEILSPEHIKIAMKAEAKRMKSLKIKEENLKTEKTVVLNEMEWGENSPKQSLDKEVGATAFLSHPYGHSTIGWRGDVENATAEKMQSLYNKNYRPENAYVTIIGDFEKKKILQMVKKYFENIKNPKGKILKNEIKEPKQKGPRRTTVKKKANTNIVQISFKMPPSDSEDILKVVILSRILGVGITSRLHEKLIEKNKATKKEILSHPFKDGYLFSIYITLAKGQKHQEIENIVLSEIEKIKKKGVSDKELGIAKNNELSEYVFSKDGVENILWTINEYIASSDWAEYTKIPEKIKKIKTKNIKEVANKYLNENSKTTGWFVAQK